MATETFTLYRQRWANLFLFCLLTISNATIYITAAAVEHPMRSFFSLNRVEVNWLSMIFMALYVPGSIYTAWTMKKIGLRKSFVLASVMNAVGAWIRVFGAKSDTEARSHGYVFLMVGQAIAGLHQPFFTNASARLAADWFGVKERDVATTIGAVCNVLGIGIGMVVPAFFVPNMTPGVPASGFFSLLITLAGFASFCALLTIVFFRDSPPTPPSLSQLDKEEQSSWNQVKSLATNKDFLFLCLSFGIGLAVFNALTTLVAQITAPAGYTNNDSSIFGGVLIGAGLLGAGIGAYIMETFRKYREMFKIGFVLASAAIVFVIFAIKPDQLAVLTVAFGLAGFIVLPLLPLSFELGVECTYPISEELSSGGLMSAGTVLSLILINVMDVQLDEWPSVQKESFWHGLTTPMPATITVMGALPIGFLAAMLFKGKYFRQEAEKREREPLLSSNAEAVNYC